MNRLLQALALGAFLLGTAASAQADPCLDCRSGGGSCGANCGSCAHGGCGFNLFQRRAPNSGGGKYAYASPCAGYGMMAPSDGQAPTIAYPYYTTRGPRDFFVNNPPSIGR